MRFAQRKPIDARSQSGASLLVSLIFLLIMAMLGVAVANVTTLQERMAGHTRDRDLALQAAEVALRDAEDRLTDPTFRAGAVAFNALNGNDDAFWTSCFTNSSSPCTATYTPTNSLPQTGPGAVAQQPRFTLERKPDLGATQIYRVTAFAVGGSTQTVVILQAEYSFTP
jgi:type IV pilus assembly protein PilX